MAQTHDFVMSVLKVHQVDGRNYLNFFPIVGYLYYLFKIVFIKS